MKKTTVLFLIVSLLFLCVSCENKLNKQRVEELYSCIPDHEMNDDCQSYMTEELYLTLREAFDIPSDGIGGELGSDEFLFYFVSGNGDCTNAKIEVGSVNLVNDSLATAEVKTSCDEETEVHQLFMELKNGEWLLSDFDSQLAVTKSYIEAQRMKMKSMQVVKEIQKCNYFSSKEKKEYIKEYKDAVKSYYEKYPSEN